MLGGGGKVAKGNTEKVASGFSCGEQSNRFGVGGDNGGGVVGAGGFDALSALGGNGALVGVVGGEKIASGGVVGAVGTVEPENV